MMTPTVHINGTSKQELSAQVEAAYRAVDDAMRALAAMSPNGRDYYVQGDGALARAEQEHASRMARLVSVKNELEEYALSLPL